MLLTSAILSNILKQIQIIVGILSFHHPWNSKKNQEIAFFQTECFLIVIKKEYHKCIHTR